MHTCGTCVRGAGSGRNHGPSAYSGQPAMNIRAQGWDNRTGFLTHTLSRDMGVLSIYVRAGLPGFIGLTRRYDMMILLCIGLDCCLRLVANRLRASSRVDLLNLVELSRPEVDAHDETDYVRGLTEGKKQKTRVLT